MFIGLLLTFTTHATTLPLWPRLRTFVPPVDCASALAAAGPGTELLALMNLSHPLAQAYLDLNTRPDDTRDRAVHADARLLILIYGDQPGFDLRRHDGRAPFEAFRRAMILWSRTREDLRRDFARDFASHVARIEWRIRPGDHSTVYLDDYVVERAFKSDDPGFWNALGVRFWDVNDRAGVTLALHQRIEDLRSRLSADADLRRELETRLSRRERYGALGDVTLAARRYAAGYAAYLKRLPPPNYDWVTDVTRRAPRRRGCGVKL